MARQRVSEKKAIEDDFEEKQDIYCPDGCQFQEEEVEEIDSTKSFITTAAREYIWEKGEEGCEKLADSDNNGCHFPEEKVEEMDNKTSFIMKGDEGYENNDYATLEIPTKIFHDMAQYAYKQLHILTFQVQTCQQNT